MKYFYPTLTGLHQPTLDLSDGLPGCRHLEVTRRVDEVLEGILRAYETEVIRIDGLDVEGVKAIHEDAYIDFLIELEKALREDEEYIPSIFRPNMSKAPIRFQGGMYSSEIGTPIIKGTVQAALNSATAAIEAAKYALDEEQSAFVLTRPPGHHSTKNSYNGYCFINNAYLVADSFKKMGKRAAVIDIDYHIGDGSLTFATEMTPYFSIHADPFTNYPYLDANFDMDREHVYLYTAKHHINADEYKTILQKVIDKALTYELDAVIISLGFDTLEGDAYQDDKIDIPVSEYRSIAAMFKAMNLPVVALLEGGYNADSLQECAYEFMCGLRG